MKLRNVWDDVSRLVFLQGNTADLEYLERAAASVEVTDLLNRLLGK